MPAIPRNLNVAALAHPRMLATSVTLPLEILRAAAQASRERPRVQVSLRLQAQTSGDMQLADGLTLRTEALNDGPVPDVLLVPAIWRHPRWVIKHHPWQIDEIKRCIAGGSWVCSVGSGSFLVAETGALEGSMATTHWHWFDEFASRYPAVRLRRDQLITQTGRVFCVGSVNSIADLMVYLSSQLFSREVALAIENQFSPEIRRRFSPHSLSATGDAHNDERIMDAQLLIRNRLQDPVNLSALAHLVDMSPRTLSRRFNAAVGMSPGEYLSRLRIEEARSLLHHSNLSVAEVGWQTGFRDPSRFSREFSKRVGVTPKRYRTAVRGKSFNLSMD